MIRLFEYRVYPKTEEPIPFCWKVLFVLFMLGTLLAMAAVCSSCQPEEGGMEDMDMEGLPATIRVEVQGEEQANFVTRTVNESVISDLHILVYNSAGELIGQKYQTGSSTVTINTRSATGCTIYAVANTGKADLFKGYTMHKESYLKSMVYSLTNWDDLNKGTNLPMTGSMKSVNIKVGANTLSGTLVLTRMVAKVELKIKVKENSGINITNLKIYNLPKSSYYVSGTADATNTTWLNCGGIGPSSTTTAGTIFYMFENRRGTKTISAQKDKTTANAPAHATYVEINGTIGTVTAKWTVYLGENNTSDFNIKRNGNYTYNITLNDVAVTDTRVVVDFTGTEDLSSAGTANCYLAKKVNTWYKFKATVRGNGAATAALISPTGSALAANAAISPTSAELVWETNGHGQIIQGVILKDGYVYFKTGPKAEGNAVIAVNDRSGIVLWSWHIWKTSFDLAEFNSNHTQTYKTNPRKMSTTIYANTLSSRDLIMMDRNLGAADNTPSNTDNVAKTFGLYYQFGRKDPFPNAKKRERRTTAVAEVIDIVDKDNNPLTINELMKYPYQTLNSDISKDVKDLILYSIKNALTFILRDDKDGLTDDTFSGNWIYGAYKGTSALDASNKLWGSDFVDKSGNLALNATFSGKTIYDPCPVGWCIPPQDTWTNFTKNTPEQWNNYNIAGTTGSGTFIKYYNCPVEDQKNWTDGDGMGFMKAPVFGRRFYIRGEGGDVAFYPAEGCRFGKDGTTSAVGSGCYSWSSAPTYATSPDGGYFITNLSWVYPVGYTTRSYAIPVRCVKETSL